MSAEAKALIDKALQLGEEERLDVIDSLIASLDASRQAEVRTAWANEVARRADEIDRGVVELAPADEVLATVRRELAELRVNRRP